MEREVMGWLLAAGAAVAAVIALRWAASAVWVRLISDRWNVFDAKD